MNRKTIQQTISLIIFLVIFSNSLFAQNTLNYTEPDLHYRNGIEFFEKNNFAAAHNEFDLYLQRPSVLLQDNDFLKSDASYHNVLCALYLTYPETELLAERFLKDYPDHPKTGTLYKQMGLYFYDSGDFGKAVTYLEKSLRRNTNPAEIAEAKFKLAISYQNLNNEKSALNLFNELKTSDNQEYSVPSSYYAATIEFKNADYENAVADFKRIENVGTYRGEVPSWISFALYKQGKFDEMLKYTSKILAEPQNGRKLDEIALLTAEVYFQRSNYVAAAKYYTMFNNYRSQRMLPAVQYRYGYSLYKIEDYKKAAENLKAIAATPDTLGQYGAYILGICYLKQDNPTYALGAFDQARKANYNQSVKEEAYFHHAKVLSDVGQSDEAIREFNEFLRLYPNSKFEEETNTLMAETYLTSNNYSAALQYIEGLKKRTPKINDAYQKIAFNQAVNEYNAGLYPQSLKNFQKTIDTPNDLSLKNEAVFWKAEALSASQKYEQAIPLYNQLLASNDNTDNMSVLRLKSRYGLAYSYYNMKNYESANTQFQAYADAIKNSPDKKNMEDAYVRLGDTYFVQNKFIEALNYYNQALATGKGDRDYALMQKGLCLAFTDKEDQAKTAFEQVISQYPNSRYADDAMYQFAVIDLAASRYQPAAFGFTRLIREKPKSFLISKALLKRAIAYSNIQQTEAAIADYKNILKNYPNSTEFDPALQGLQDQLNNVGRSEDFQEILKEIKRSKPEDGSLEGVEFSSAKNMYLNEKYDKAIPALKAYLQNYPFSANQFEAKYLIADSYFRAGDKQNALKYYYQVIADNKFSKVNAAAARAADIEFGNANYPRAITNYRALLSIAGNKKDVQNANIGLMKAYYLTNKYDSTQYYSREVQSGGDVVAGARSLAFLYSGKVELSRNNYSNATQAFDQVINIAKDENGAEAKYLNAMILNKNRKFADSNKMVFALDKEFPDYEHWRGMAFLLASDNYVALNEMFQARKTLESIIDAATDKEVVSKAKEKLRVLDGFEKQDK